MDFEWDDLKNEANRQKHRIGFEAMVDFDWGTAKITDRSRPVDEESRFAAIGLLKGRIFTVIYTWRKGAVRLISLRRSNKSEEKAYGQEN